MAAATRLAGVVLSVGGLLMATASAGATPDDGGTAPPGDIYSYPLAEGDFTVSEDFGWGYFKTPDGRSCGIGGNGGPAGCDAVAADAPPGANQVSVIIYQPGAYEHSDTASFTRSGVDTLPLGYRLDNRGSTCAVTAADTVRCEVSGGRHGFILSAQRAVFW